MHPEELASKSEEVNGCWIWTAGKSSGYGKSTLAGRGPRPWYIHRLAYSLLVGPLVPGMTIDHLCHNADESCPGGPTCPHRACWNPEHLEQVPHAVNVARGRGSWHEAASKASAAVRQANAASRTHCGHGHELTSENTYLYPNGDRRCRECRRMWKQGQNRKQKQARQERRSRESNPGSRVA